MLLILRCLNDLVLTAVGHSVLLNKQWSLFRLDY